MKNIYIYLFLILNITVQSQNIKIENGIFYTIEENGVKQNKNIKFEVDNKTLEKIKMSDSYKETLEAKDFLKINKEKYKISDPLVAHLRRLTYRAVWKTTLGMENEMSFDFIDGSVGRIYINDKDELIFVFYFKRKNELGNELLFESRYNFQTEKLNILN